MDKNLKNKVFNVTSSFKSADKDDGSVVIRGLASTNDVDRVGDVIAADAWAKGGLNNFNNNPIILFNHNHDKPIGKALSIEATEGGLNLEARISKAAGDAVELIKDGVLGAFSVGFMVKDAEYIEETDGFLIKEAELFEVSVVSVPCNQSATFSISKSFENMEDYEAFRKSIVESSNIPGIGSSATEDNSSNAADLNSEKAARKAASQENLMEKDNKKTAEDIAREAAEKAANKVAADRKAEEAAAQKAAADKAAQEAKEVAQKDEIKNLINEGVKSNSEELMKTLEEKLNDGSTSLKDIMDEFRKELEEKKEELTLLQNSKRVFSDRGNKSGLEAYAKELSEANLLGVITGKGYDTDFAKSIMEKAGIDYATNAPDIDQTVARTIEKEIRVELRAANLFREIPVISGATVLPIQPESEKAEWAIAAAAGNLENRGASNNTFRPSQVILNAERLVSSTYLDNDVDEQVVVGLLPMLMDAVVHAHARAVDTAILLGNGSNINGLDTDAATGSTTLGIGAGDKLTADILLGARKQMGKYGLKPSEVAYIVSQAGYYDLLEDTDFQNLDEVGSDIAIKITGTVGAVFGSPVVVSDNFEDAAAGAAAAFAVNVRSYVIPRLRGVKLEQDYEVANQRKVIVASQSLGFEELVAGSGANQPSVKVDYAA